PSAVSGMYLPFQWSGFEISRSPDSESRTARSLNSVTVISIGGLQSQDASTSRHADALRMDGSHRTAAPIDHGRIAEWIFAGCRMIGAAPARRSSLRCAYGPFETPSAPPAAGSGVPCQGRVTNVTQFPNSEIFL